jgi:PAS domain S-box-containing protein
MVPWSAKLSRRNIVIVWAVVLVAGIAVGWAVGRHVKDGLEVRLIDQTQRCANALTREKERAQLGTPGDQDGQAVEAIRHRMALMQSLIPDARILCLLRYVPSTAKVLFLADSSPGGISTLRSGEDYPDASRLKALQLLLYTNLPEIQEPQTDPSGTWAMGFAALPIEGDHKDILALDVSADDWRNRELGAAIPAALYTWLLLGVPFGLVVALRGRRDQRKALRNLLGAMEQSQSAVMIVDLDDCIEYVNASLCAQIGCPRRELLGRQWRDVQHPETPAELLSEMNAAIHSGNSWKGEWFNRRRTGETYPVRGTISPVRNRDGSLACFIAVFEDMTDAKRAEDALREALSRAEAGDRAKSQFLATMSHEVRTPLNGVIGFTSLLLETQLTPEQEEYIQIIRTNGEALIQLTGDILDFAHIESGSLKLEYRPCNPRACIEETLDLIAVQASRKRIELVHWVDENVPALIESDEARLRQVLVNLAGNAVKFTEEGEIELTLRAERGSDTGAPADWLLTFSVRDTGIGIAAGDQDKLFKPFNQVDVSITRRHGGTGLGLAISRNLVHLMGGSISVESGAGRGSTFTFTLPVSASPGAMETPPARPGMRLALAARPGPFRREFAKLARRWKATLTEFDSAREITAGEWDFVFVDVDLELARSLAAEAPPPPADGQLREAPRRVTWPADRTYAVVPISLPRELRAGLRSHFAQVLNKPLHHEGLAAMLAGARPATPPPAEDKPSRFGYSVLVAEDNVINQRLVQKILWNLGCTSTVAADGRAAIEELKRGSEAYDLVLMDLHMPEIDGLEAIRRIRGGEAGEHAARQWIAAVTADARNEQRERVLGAGGNDYVIKPIKVGELAAALRRYEAARKKA